MENKNMDILSRLNVVIDFIEKNLTKEIEYDEVAKLACMSTYNFHRMYF